MSMGSEIPALTRPPASGSFSLPRFPIRWAVESAEAERNLARVLWLLVPLQYYVVTNMGRGFSADDLIPAVALSLVTVVVIFLLSCVVAWLASAVWPPDPKRGDTLTGRVRMWVVALMIGTAAGYILLALSLVATHIAVNSGKTIYYDLVTHGLAWVSRTLGSTVQALDFRLQLLANLIYASVALLVFLLAYRILRGSAASPSVQQEPGVISVGLVVAVVMTVANWIAMLP